MPTEHVYLSPHLDDAALSCGGLIHQQASRGEHVTVWTICAADPPTTPLSDFALDLHRQWGDPEAGATALRRAEDLEACLILGARPLHGTFPDAIYRTDPETGAFLYPSRHAIFAQLHPSDLAWANRLTDLLLERLSPDSHVYCPLGAGNHVDHQLVRGAVEAWAGPAAFYEDFPYAAESGAVSGAQVGGDWQPWVVSLGEADLRAKADAVACYRSQLSTFWPDEPAMRAALRAFARASAAGSAGPAERLWRRLRPRPPTA